MSSVALWGNKVHFVVLFVLCRCTFHSLPCSLEECLSSYAFFRKKEKNEMDREIEELEITTRYHKSHIKCRILYNYTIWDKDQFDPVEPLA